MFLFRCLTKESYQKSFFLRFLGNLFLLVCRMITIFWLTQSTRLGGPFRYLEHVRQANRKFSRGLWKKVSAQKMGFCQNIPTRFWASFFQNLNFFHFSWHKIWLVRRAVTIFLLTQKARLRGPFRYLEHVRKVNKNFLEAFEKSWDFENMELKIELEYFDKTRVFFFFELKLFSHASTKLSIDFTNTFKVSERSSQPRSLRQEKIVTVRRTNQIVCQEKWKSWDFEKMKLEIELEYSDKTPFLGAETFFQVPLENFL